MLFSSENKIVVRGSLLWGVFLGGRKEWANVWLVGWPPCPSKENSVGEILFYTIFYMHLLSVSNKDYKLMHYSIFFKNQNLGHSTNFIMCLLKISTRFGVNYKSWIYFTFWTGWVYYLDFYCVYKAKEFISIL